MSKSFSFDEEVAKQYGVEEAVMIRSFQFWIDLNKANGRNLREGRTWTYNTYASLSEQFLFFNEDRIRRLIESLVKQGVILKTSKFNKLKYDKTNWYAFEDECKWIKTEKDSEISLADLPEAEGLFAQENINDNFIAEGGETNSNSPSAILPVAQVIKVKETEIDKKLKKAIGNSAISTDESASPTGNIARLEAANLPDQYQILNSSSTVKDEEEKNLVINPFGLLIKKTPLDAYLDGTADKLAFDFNDPDLVNKKISQLFRLFIKDVQPIEIHTMQIGKELLDDMRPELSRKVCWVIILIVFMEYPGTDKKYQNVNSLLRKIGWKKDDFVQALHTYKQKVETTSSRIKEREQLKNNNQEAIEQILKDAADKLQRYSHKLNTRQVEEITALIKNRNYLQADAKLIEYIEQNEIEA